MKLTRIYSSCCKDCAKTPSSVEKLLKEFPSLELEEIDFKTDRSYDHIVAKAPAFVLHFNMERYTIYGSPTFRTLKSWVADITTW